MGEQTQRVDTSRADSVPTGVLKPRRVLVGTARVLAHLWPAGRDVEAMRRDVQFALRS
jgi:hypothetical protein